MHRLLLSFFFPMLSLFGEFSDFIKKVEDKGHGHNIKNIDFIYMINLDKRVEKWVCASESLMHYGIVPYRFSAIDGRSLSLEAINNLGVKFTLGMTPLMATKFVNVEGSIVGSQEFMRVYGTTYFAHKFNFGKLGCALSHISVLQDAYDSGYQTIWVMEDDIEIFSDPNQLTDLIDELDGIIGSSNWDVLFTDIDARYAPGKYVPALGAAKRPDMDCSFAERYSEKYTETIRLNKNFKKISARFGTYSMVIRRSGIIKLLEFFKSHGIFLPYDMENYFPQGIQRYGLNFDLVTNKLNSITDIGREF